MGPTNCKVITQMVVTGYQRISIITGPTVAYLHRAVIDRLELHWEGQSHERAGEDLKKNFCFDQNIG